MVVLKELICNMVSTLGACGVLEGTDFSHFLLCVGYGGHESN